MHIGVQTMKGRSSQENRGREREMQKKQRDADGENGIKKKGKIRREPARNEEKQLPMIVHRI